MTIILNKNSFITKEDADIYFDERYDSKIWQDTDDETKEKLLITASRKINSFDYTGEKADETQPMEFPRNYGTPQDIKDAVCEEAISMLSQENNVHKKNQENNISSISLGAGSVSYSGFQKTAVEKEIISHTALYLISKWMKKGYAMG